MTRDVARDVESIQGTTGQDLHEFCTVVAEDLEQLAILHDAEPGAALIGALQQSQFPLSLGLQLTTQRGEDACALVAEALVEFPRPIDSRELEVLGVDYVNIYLSHVLRASPYESVWLDEEHLERQLPMFQIREYFRRHHVAPADWQKRTEDHLVLQLQFIAHLFANIPEESARETIAEASRFMDEHLLRWLPKFAERVAQRCSTKYFAGIAVLTAAYCDELREALADMLGEPRPSADDIERRMAASLCSSTQVTQPTPFLPGVGPAV